MRQIFIYCLFLFTLSSIKAETRLIDFTIVINGLDGKPIMIPDGKGKQEALTLNTACVNALETSLEEDRQMPGEAKFKLDELAHKIYNKNGVSLTAEEVVLIKQRVGKLYNPLVVGAVWRILDPSSSEIH
jgi:hypothetical protein